MEKFKGFDRDFQLVEVGKTTKIDSLAGKKYSENIDGINKTIDQAKQGVKETYRKARLSVIG